MQNVRFKSGAVILRKGDEGASAYLIVSGAAEVILGEGAKARTVATLGPGDVFGEMSLLAPGPRSATVRATADTECTVTSYDEFMDALQTNPEQAMQFMKTLVMRLRKMNEMVASVDPGRGLAGVLWGWVSAADLEDPALTREERERREAIATMPPLF